jgi:membrane-associated phospholipid phosphatase
MGIAALKDMDRRWSEMLKTWNRGTLRQRVFAVIAHSADSFVLVPLFVLLWFLIQDKELYFCLACTYLLSAVLSTVLKYLVRRKRPRGEWGKFYRRTDPFSFPSGHAARTVAFTVVLFARVSVGAGSAVLFWTAAVCLSRIILGIHYLSDIGAGSLLGILLAAAVCFTAPHLGLV